MKKESKGHYEIHYPENRLEKMISRSAGPSLEDIMSEANKELEALANQYPAIVRESIANMRALLQELDDPAQNDEALKKIFGEAHDIKGQSSTFGYNMLGEVAASLCHLIDTDQDLALRNKNMIAMHIDALFVLVQENVETIKPAQGKELLATLHQAVDRVLQNIQQ